MAFYAARHFNLYPMSTFVKVGDTLADVEEAHAAGMWAVSVVRHGNEVGLSKRALDELPPAELDHVIESARARLAAKNPHYIIDSTADLLPVVDEISARISRGERP
jgi:phosphonoacetaldehyde hydrolase